MQDPEERRGPDGGSDVWAYVVIVAVVLLVFTAVLVMIHGGTAVICQGCCPGLAPGPCSSL